MSDGKNIKRPDKFRKIGREGTYEEEEGLQEMGGQVHCPESRVVLLTPENSLITARRLSRTHCLLSRYNRQDY